MNKTFLKNNLLPGNNKIKSFGPVTNLEEHVLSDWWRHIFNSLYLKTDADVVDDKNITVKEIDLFLQILQIKKEDLVLDISCGQGRHSLELARRGFKNINGLDRSRFLIQKAKKQARTENLSAGFKEGDARQLPYPVDTFNKIMILGNSFGYFETIKDDLQVLKEVIRVGQPSGKLLIDVADGEFLSKNFQPRSWEWIDNEHFVCRERSLSFDKQRLISREVITNVKSGVIADQFYAERLYTKDSITKLLEKAGFSAILFHGEINTESARGIDLGMMEKRIICTALIKKEWAKVKRIKQEQKSVAILMGDPVKPDIIKPQAVFDDDDFYTIDQLKGALREIKNYNYNYISDHDSLFNYLSKNKSKIDFVFNLCDEGFNNNARMELHIPAMLEMLDIPFTGSGPQCLAFCYDKSLVRGIAKEMEIPVPEAFFIKPEDNIFELSLDFPLIAKPNFGDSSFGITARSVASNHDSLMNAISEIRDKFGYEKPILIEEFLNGKDISVGIIGNLPDNYLVLPIIEEDYSNLPADLPQICGYEAKWQPDSPYWNIKSIPANLPEMTEKFLIESCLKLFERLECRDYCRFDWRLDKKGTPKLLEVNPNPGWCWDGHLAKMARLIDLSYKDMLSEILKAAEKRIFNC